VTTFILPFIRDSDETMVWFQREYTFEVSVSV